MLPPLQANPPLSFRLDYPFRLGFIRASLTPFFRPLPAVFFEFTSRRNLYENLTMLSVCGPVASQALFSLAYPSPTCFREGAQVHTYTFARAKGWRASSTWRKNSRMMFGARLSTATMNYIRFIRLFPSISTFDPRRRNGY